MSGPIKHYIVTRFNVASPGRELAIRLRPGWLDGRFELFRDWCLPSVAAQSSQDFEWIVFFDEQTPDQYRGQIRALQDLYPFRAEFTGEFDMSRIAPQLFTATGAAEWLLTTRLDGDDSLATDFVARLRGALNQPRSLVVNFRQGAILSIKDSHPRLYHHEDDSNPFASLLEPAGPGVRTIWGEKHVDIARIGEVLQIDGPAAWLQIVHGTNVSNRIKGKRIPLASVASLFAGVAKYPADAQESEASIRWENQAMAPLRQFKEWLRIPAKAVYYAVLRRLNRSIP